jgi:modulator of FtsH protease HflK
MSSPPQKQSPLDLASLGIEFNPAGFKMGLIFALLFLIALTVFQSFYTVPAESEGVVIRFGRYHDQVDSGLRFKVPFIDDVILVPVKRQLKQEFGFDSGSIPIQSTRRSRSRSRKRNPYESKDGYRSASEITQEQNMVTGDLNAAQVEWVVQYRITDPKDFLFKVRQPEDTLRDLSESSMREVIGDRTVDEVITVGRQEIESEVLSKLQKRCNEYELGLTIDQVQLKNVNPPAPVQPSFNEVNQAQQEREKAINVANGEYNRAVPRARGEADQQVQSAQGYLDKRVNEAEGDIQRFKALYAEYLKAPEVTKRRLFIETMSEVLKPIKGKVIIDHNLKQLLPLLNLQPTTAGR